MDITVLAPLVVSALLPLFKEMGSKALNKLAEKSGEEAFNQRGAILEKVKNVFFEDDFITLGLLAENPEDAKTQGKLEGKLEDRLKANPEIAGELETMLAELQKAVASEIINERVKDSDLSNKLKRSGEGGGDASISNKDVDRSRIVNEIDIS